MTVERFNRKLDANTARMLRNEDRGALKMYKILEDSRMELIAKLSRHTERGNGYSMAYYQAMLADVEAVMAEMYARATAMMKEEMTSAFTLGQSHMGAEVAIFETGLAVITPRVSTTILDIIVNERTEFIGRLTESVKRTMMDEIRREAATRAANQSAASAGVATEVIQQQLLQEQVSGIKNSLAKGFVQGDSVPQIVRRLTHPTDGTFIRMARPSAIRTVRIGMNDTYNEGRNEQLRSVHERLPHIKRAWRSALQDSTPICLHLHGQKCSVGESFKYGGWQGDRPPAIGGSAEPKFHLCRSVVVATSERWPVNPLLEPLSPERIKHFESKNGKPGGRFQGRDIVRPNQGPRPQPGTKPAPRPMPVQPALLIQPTEKPIVTGPKLPWQGEAPTLEKAKWTQAMNVKGEPIIGANQLEFSYGNSRVRLMNEQGTYMTDVHAQGLLREALKITKIDEMAAGERIAVRFGPSKEAWNGIYIAGGDGYMGPVTINTIRKQEFSSRTYRTPRAADIYPEHPKELVTLVHELGHSAHYSLLRINEDSEDKWNKRIKSALTKAKKSESPVSAYGASNYHEYFAETWAAYHFDSAKLLATNPTGHKLMEDAISELRSNTKRTVKKPQEW